MGEQHEKWARRTRGTQSKISGPPLPLERGRIRWQASAHRVTRGDVIVSR